jgi:signal transduction histidine kinase
LAIVSRIIDAHRGKIRVESALGKGTTITLIFPADAKS